MRIIAEGTIFAGEAGTDHASCAFPGIAVLPGGRWLCGFRAAPVKGATAGQHARVTYSDDAGHAWSPAVIPAAPPALGGRPGAFRAAYPTALGGTRALLLHCWVDESDPALPFFNPETEGLLDTRLFITLSEDGGATWGRPAPVETTPFTMPTPPTGPILLLPDGRWLCQFELNKPYYDTTPWRHSSVVIFSSDEGRTWPAHAVVSSDPRVFYWDQRVGLLADGTLLDVFWTYDNGAAGYLNIHARESNDGGRTWSDLWDTGVPGQPAAPVSLPDGRIVMVYVDRTAAPVIKARVSADGGHAWEEETIVYRMDIATQTVRKDSMEDAWAEMAAFSLGLPATAALPNGDVLVVFYAGPATDLTDIRWARLRG